VKWNLQKIPEIERQEQQNYEKDWPFSLYKSGHKGFLIEVIYKSSVNLCELYAKKVSFDY